MYEEYIYDYVPLCHTVFKSSSDVESINYVQVAKDITNECRPSLHLVHLILRKLNTALYSHR
jgi:hypothetical protein